MFLFCLDDCIFISPEQKDVDQAIKDLSNKRKAKIKYNMDDQGDINNYLGINFVI